MTTVADLILFDLNGVLYRYDRDARIADLGSIANLSPQAVKAAIWESGFEDTGDSGLLDEAAYLLGFGVRLGYLLSETEWLAAQAVALTPIAETLALLPRLRPQVRCAVLTNNNLLVKRHFAALYPEIAAMMGTLAFVSAEFGARKPEAEAYRRCVGQIGVDPAATLFIDDSAANVAGARKAGLQGWHHTGPDELEAELLRLGLIS